jgi:hypothetical protein
MGQNMASLGRRGAAITLGVAMITATGLGASALGAPGGGRGNDTPATVCHKPGTPAQHELTFDNDALTQAHLRHGDTLGSCHVPETPAAPIAEPGAAAAAPATPVSASPRLTG